MGKSDESTASLGTYTQWAEGFSKASLDRALRDQVVLKHGELNNGNDDCRYTRAQQTKQACDTLRAERDNLDYREWNADSGFSGVTRWPEGPGMSANGVQTEGQKRRRARRVELDDGF